MKIGKNQITGILMVIIGIVVLVLISQFSIAMTISYPGPKLFPMIAAIGLVALGIGIFFQEQSEQDGVVINTILFKRLGIMFGITILYILALKYLGFLITSPVYLYAVVSFFLKENNQGVTTKTWQWQRVVFSIVVPVLVYLFYVYLFGSKLPAGLLFE